MTRPNELPPEGDEAEARELIARHPIELPKYRLERVKIGDLEVDYAPPHANGYARQLSIVRLNWLRRHWDPMACGALTVSRRDSGLLYLIDGNHRRVVAFEMGMNELPAVVFSGIDRAREADLYTKLGTVLGQTPSTRFRSKLVAGDKAAEEIMRVILKCDLDLDTAGGKHRDGVIQAVSRVEWIYARGGSDGLEWTLSILGDTFEGVRESLGEMMLEGVFGFWLRYGTIVNDDHLVTVLNGAGMNAILDRADAINRRYVSTRGNAVGRALLEIYNGSKRPAGTPQLPSWADSVVGPNVDLEATRFRTRNETGSFVSPYQAGPHSRRAPEQAAPQRLVRT